MADLTQEALELWITEESTGEFHYKAVLNGLIHPSLYGSLRTMMGRAVKKGVAMPVGKHDGYYRKIDSQLDEVRWWDGEGGDFGEAVLLPLGLQRYCYIAPPAMILVAGVYNQGKTAFCLNVVNLNIEKWEDRPINLFCSEGLEQLKWKFGQMQPAVPIPPPFKVYRRLDNFADVIEPDGLNVVDYLRTDMEDPKVVAQRLFEINKKLGPNGVAVVAMQKPRGRKIAFGGESTAWEPALYVAVDKGRSKGESVLEFEKIKAPRALDYDPYMAKIYFSISRGVNIEQRELVVE